MARQEGLLPPVPLGSLDQSAPMQAPNGTLASARRRLQREVMSAFKQEDPPTACGPRREPFCGPACSNAAKTFKQGEFRVMKNNENFEL